MATPKCCAQTPEAPATLRWAPCSPPPSRQWPRPHRASAGWAGTHASCPTTPTSPSAATQPHSPQVAIGGIGAEQFPQVLATGVGSIAVVRALVNAPDPDEAARQLMGR